MEGDAVAAGLLDLLEVVLGVRDHQVAVEDAAGLRGSIGAIARRTTGPDRDRLDEMAVADVEVEDARARVEQVLHLRRRARAKSAA